MIHGVTMLLLDGRLTPLVKLAPEGTATDELFEAMPASADKQAIGPRPMADMAWPRPASAASTHTDHPHASLQSFDLEITSAYLKKPPIPTADNGAVDEDAKTCTGGCNNLPAGRGWTAMPT